MYIVLDCSFIIFWLIELLTQLYFLFCERKINTLKKNGLFSGVPNLVCNMFLKTKMDCFQTPAGWKHLDLLDVDLVTSLPSVSIYEIEKKKTLL